MQFRLAIVAFLLAATAVALPASAQQGQDFTITVTAPSTRISPTESTTLDVKVTVGCIRILQAGADVDVDLDVVGPEWLDAVGETVSFAPEAACADANLRLTKSGTVTITPNATAPGLTASTLKVTGTYADATDAEVSEESGEVAFEVEYRPGHTVVSELTFPHTMTGTTLKWNVTVSSDANYRTMIMFNDVTATTGVVDGLSPKFIDNPPGSLTFEVTFTAPDSAWTNSTISFVNFSHWCSTTGTCGLANLTQDYEWQILNGNPPPEESKGLPSNAAGLILVGLASLVLMLRRRLA